VLTGAEATPHGCAARIVVREIAVTLTPQHQNSTVDADLFRALLRRRAAAVVVGTAAGTPPAGFTATSFTSVSLDPPPHSSRCGWLLPTATQITETQHPAHD
jgi:hypothetical protein